MVIVITVIAGTHHRVPPVGKAVAVAVNTVLIGAPINIEGRAGAAVGRQYGAFIQRGERVMTNRTLFIVDADGRIAHRAAPFREIDPMAYTELGEALDRIAPPEATEPGN